jgi:hypothetical protein
MFSHSMFSLSTLSLSTSSPSMFSLLMFVPLRFSLRRSVGESKTFVAGTLLNILRKRVATIFLRMFNNVPATKVFDSPTEHY